MKIYNMILISLFSVPLVSVMSCQTKRSIYDEYGALGYAYKEAEVLLNKFQNDYNEVMKNGDQISKDQARYRYAGINKIQLEALFKLMIAERDRLAGRVSSFKYTITFFIEDFRDFIFNSSDKFDVLQSLESEDLSHLNGAVFYYLHQKYGGFAKAKEIFNAGSFFKEYNDFFNDPKNQPDCLPPKAYIKNFIDIEPVKMNRTMEIIGLPDNLKRFIRHYLAKIEAHYKFRPISFPLFEVEKLGVCVINVLHILGLHPYAVSKKTQIQAHLMDFNPFEFAAHDFLHGQFHDLAMFKVFMTDRKKLLFDMLKRLGWQGYCIKKINDNITQKKQANLYGGIPYSCSQGQPIPKHDFDFSKKRKRKAHGIKVSSKSQDDNKENYDENESDIFMNNLDCNNSPKKPCLESGIHDDKTYASSQVICLNTDKPAAINKPGSQGQSDNKEIYSCSQGANKDNCANFVNEEWLFSAKKGSQGVLSIKRRSAGGLTDLYQELVNNTHTVYMRFVERLFNKLWLLEDKYVNEVHTAFFLRIHELLDGYPMEDLPKNSELGQSGNALYIRTFDSFLPINTRCNFFKDRTLPRILENKKIDKTNKIFVRFLQSKARESGHINPEETIQQIVILQEIIGNKTYSSSQYDRVFKVMLNTDKRIGVKMENVHIHKIKLYYDVYRDCYLNLIKDRFVCSILDPGENPPHKVMVTFCVDMDYYMNTMIRNATQICLEKPEVDDLLGSLEHALGYWHARSRLAFQKSPSRSPSRSPCKKALLRPKPYSQSPIIRSPCSEFDLPAPVLSSPFITLSPNDYNLSPPELGAQSPDIY